MDFDFKSTAFAADAESGNIALTLQATDAAGYPAATVVLTFRTRLDPSETVAAFQARAESEARNTLKAAVNFGLTPHRK